MGCSRSALDAEMLATPIRSVGIQNLDQTKPDVRQLLHRFGSVQGPTSPTDAVLSGRILRVLRRY
jgi:hypothetical protein